jgi:hypothetical protein
MIVIWRWWQEDLARGMAHLGALSLLKRWYGTFQIVLS